MSELSKYEIKMLLNYYKNELDRTNNCIEQYEKSLKNITNGVIQIKTENDCFELDNSIINIEILLNSYINGLYEKQRAYGGSVWSLERALQ